jgi:hypothetical protein
MHFLSEQSGYALNFPGSAYSAEIEEKMQGSVAKLLFREFGSL